MQRLGIKSTRYLRKSILATSLALVTVDGFGYDPKNPCNLPTPPPPVVYTDFLDRGIIDCVPWPFQGITDSNSTNWDFYRTPTGYVAAWYCKGDNGKWGYQLASITNAEVDSKPGYFTSLAADLLATQAANPASAPSQVLSAVAKTRVNTSQNNESQAAAWCPAWQFIWNKWPEPKNIPVAPPPSHVVINPTTYLIRSGALVPLSSKATVGNQCTCNPGTTINGKLYCPFVGQVSPAIVAECS